MKRILILCESNNSLPAARIVEYSRIMRAWINHNNYQAFAHQSRKEKYVQATVYMGAPCWQHSFTCKRWGLFPFDVAPKLLVVLPFHFNLFWQSLHVTVPAPLFFSKCFRTDDELADDSSIAKTGFFFYLRLFCACASGTNNSNNETKFEHRWMNTFIRIFDLFVSPLNISLCECVQMLRNW